MDNLTLVIPAKNEKESLPTVLKELEKLNLHIIIVLEKMTLRQLILYLDMIVKFYIKITKDMEMH